MHTCTFKTRETNPNTSVPLRIGGTTLPLLVIA
jgi:hypothetical protein